MIDEDRPYPVCHALADVTALAGAAVCASRSQRPERVQALALREGETTRLLLANVTCEPHPVRVEGLAGVARRSPLGEAGADECGLELELLPYAIVRLDVRPDRS